MMKYVCSAVLAVLALLLMAACGGGGGASNPPVVDPPATPPAFTSTPGISASEGAAYTYKLVASAGTSVTYTLTSGPAGATLSGDTITWTPTAAQSRVKNDFKVTVTASGSGLNATQSWSVTPNGTIRISLISTVWSATGPTNTYPDYTASLYALVPQTDGSFRKLSSSGTGDGEYTISNVPGGYFWLSAGFESFWTSSSLIDLSSDTLDPSLPPELTEVSTRTAFNFNFDGLDPIEPLGELVVSTKVSTTYYDILLDTTFSDSASPGLCEWPFQQTYALGGTTYKGTCTIFSHRYDYSKAQTAFVAQFIPMSLGAMNFLTLGPSLQIENPSWKNGVANAIAGKLISGQRNTLNLSVNGAAWKALLNGVAPSETDFAGSQLRMAVMPYVTQRDKIPNFNYYNMPLLTSRPLNSQRPCDKNVFSSSIYTQPAVTTDIDLGALSYSDPFPPSWPRVFSFCQGTELSVPIPASNGPFGAFLDLNLGFGIDAATPANPVTPLVGPVQNLKIGSSSLLAPITINTASPTLTWQAPTVGTANLYEITAIDLTEIGAIVFPPIYAPQTYETGKTSATLVLKPGHTYVFTIVAVADARANVETSPNRSALPRGYASSISAPITVDPSAPPVVIQ